MIDEARDRDPLQALVDGALLDPDRANLAELAADFGDAGDNDVFLYFAESPPGRLESPGLFRIVAIPVNFQPPASRTPDDPILFITDDEFVRAGF